MAQRDSTEMSYSDAISISRNSNANAVNRPSNNNIRQGLSIAQSKNGSSAFINPFITTDQTFMLKISSAIDVVKRHFGSSGLKACIEINDDGIASVQMDQLCNMLRKAEKNMQHDCFKHFIFNPTTIGSICYLIGGLCFGAVAFYDHDTMSQILTRILSSIGTLTYIIGAISFMFSVLKPYWDKQQNIKAIRKETIKLKKGAQIVRQMTANACGHGKPNITRESSVSARPSQIGIDLQDL